MANQNTIVSQKLRFEAGKHALTHVQVPAGATFYRIAGRSIHFFSGSATGAYPVPPECAELGRGYVATFLRDGNKGHGNHVKYSRLMMPETPGFREGVSNLNRYPPDIGQTELPYKRRKT